MMKHVFLVGAMLMTAPAVAQTAPDTPPQTTPAVPAPSAPTAPPTADPVAPPVDAATPPAAPATDPAAPAPDAQAVTPAPTDPATAAAAPAPTPAAAAAGPQVADVVGKEFPTYDKNGDGSLSKSEFSTWMLALKKTSDPNVKDDAANKAWTRDAFAQADTDKSQSISKDELTNFLAQGQKPAS